MFAGAVKNYVTSPWSFLRFYRVRRTHELKLPTIRAYEAMGSNFQTVFVITTNVEIQVLDVI
ncbi:MAG: hypothetical protein EBT07_08115 [Actinobacteria bacterium]|nr:hypothetical protein [Actinomycetota bacterium]